MISDISNWVIFVDFKECHGEREGLNPVQGMDAHSHSLLYCPTYGVPNGRSLKVKPLTRNVRVRVNFKGYWIRGFVWESFWYLLQAHSHTRTRKHRSIHTESIDIVFFLNQHKLRKTSEYLTFDIAFFWGCINSIGVTSISEFRTDSCVKREGKTKAWCIFSKGMLLLHKTKIPWDKIRNPFITQIQ